MLKTVTSAFSLKTSGARLRAYAMLGSLAVIWVVFFLTTDGAFASPRNLSNLARQSCITGWLAIGMVLVIVSANKVVRQRGNTLPIATYFPSLHYKM